MKEAMEKRRRWRFWNLFPGHSWLEYALVHTLMTMVNLFPIAVSTWMARRIGETMFVLMPGRRRIALANFTIAFGNSKSEKEKKRIVRESFRHLSTCLMEFFRLPGSLEEITRRVEIKGAEHLDQAFAREKGAVLVMSHLGPWEYLGFLTYLKKYPTAVLGRPIKNPYFYRWVQSVRRSVNLDYIDKTLGPRKLFSELKANHLVAITIDQWAGSQGLWIDLFNVPTSTTSLPALLAKRTGCALVPAYCVRIASGRYEIHVLPEVSIRESETNWIEQMTKRLNYLLEEQIRTFPEQWVWTHKRWKGRKLVNSSPIEGG